MIVAQKDFCSFLWFEVWYRINSDTPETISKFYSEDYMLVGTPVSELEVDYIYQVSDLLKDSGHSRNPQALDIVLAAHKLTKKTSAYLILDSYMEYPFFEKHTQLLGAPDTHPHVFVRLPGYSYMSKYWKW